MYIVSPIWLVMCSTTWSRVSEKDYIIEKSHSPMDIHMTREASDSLSDNLLADEDDFRIISGAYDSSVSAHFNTQEWLEMNKEVEDAMEDDDDSEDSIWNMIDEGLQEKDEDSTFEQDSNLDEHRLDLKRKRSDFKDSVIE